MDKKIKYIFIISCLIAIVYPLADIYFVFPSIANVLVKEKEGEAIRLAKTLAPLVISKDNDLKNTAELERALKGMREQFNLEKLKVFSISGEVIYSTDSKDLGELNKRDYFQKVVLKGKPYTKLVKKDNKSLEDKIVTADVVETYVPVTINGIVIGAFEIYYDITLTNQLLQRVISRSLLIPVILMFIFLAVIFVIAFALWKKTSEKFGLKYNSPAYHIVVLALSIFIAETVVMLIVSSLPQLSIIGEAILDSSLLVLIISPALYFFLLSPLLHHIAERKQAEDAQKKLVLELQEALAKVKTLSGLLPICASCKKIRDDKGYWNQIESFISEHSEAEFSHGFCPECAAKLYPEFYKKKEKE